MGLAEEARAAGVAVTERVAAARVVASLVVASLVVAAVVMVEASTEAADSAAVRAEQTEMTGSAAFWAEESGAADLAAGEMAVDVVAEVATVVATMMVRLAAQEAGRTAGSVAAGSLWTSRRARRSTSSPCCN
eukprot:5533273-Prymnesium_polylepis.1